MPLELALWPEEIIQLNKELSSGLHPELEKSLAELHGDPNWVERFATIATYCEVALDGLYDHNQICEICKVLLPRLYELRKRPDGTPQIILPIN